MTVWLVVILHSAQVQSTIHSYNCSWKQIALTCSFQTLVKWYSVGKPNYFKVMWYKVMEKRSEAPSLLPEDSRAGNGGQC